MSIYPIPNQPQANQTLRWVMLGIGLLVTTLVLCCSFFIFGGWQLIGGVISETSAIEDVIRQFMDAGRRRDIGAAEALFADTALSSISRADFERLFANRQLFREVTDLSLNSFSINTNLEGMTAEVGGTITYVDGSSSQSFTARLWKEGEQWRLVRIDFR
jgi:hypothetical protein